MALGKWDGNNGVFWKRRGIIFVVQRRFSVGVRKLGGATSEAGNEPAAKNSCLLAGRGGFEDPASRAKVVLQRACGYVLLMRYFFDGVNER